MNQKYFQKMILAGGLVLSLAGFAAAQATDGNQQGAPAQRSGTESKRGKGEGMKSLGLSDSQKAQVKSIREDAKKERDAIKNDSSLSEQQKKAKLKELRKANEVKIDHVLTPEQREKMKELRKEHRHRHGKHHGEDSTQR